MHRITYTDILAIYIVLSKSKGSAIPANTKLVYSICTTLVQHCENIIQMFCTHWDATMTHSSNTGTMLIQGRKKKYVFAPLRGGLCSPIHVETTNFQARTHKSNGYLRPACARTRGACTSPLNV